MQTPADVVTTGDLRVAYRRHGAGPPLLLLHGAVCDSRVWRVELESFADEFDVVAWDAPGCGGSADAPARFRMSDYADCLAGFMDALALEPAHVVGHSWGSTLALELCRRRPARVASLTLVGGYAGWAGSLPVEEVRRRLEFASTVAARLESGGWDPATMPGLFSPAMPPERARELAAIMAGVRPGATRTMARALAEADLRDALGTITVPTLVLHGAADERSSPEVGHALHASIPNATLTVLPGLGHECFLEDAAACARALRAFLHTQAGGRSRGARSGRGH